MTAPVAYQPPRIDEALHPSGTCHGSFTLVEGRGDVGQEYMMSKPRLRLELEHPQGTTLMEEFVD